MSAGGGTSYKDRSWFGKVLMVWTHEGSEYFANWLDSWCFDPVVVVPVFFVFLLWAAEATDPTAVTAVFAMLIATSPLWLPVGLFVFFWIMWMHYIRFAFWFGPICESILLEIQLPPRGRKNAARDGDLSYRGVEYRWRDDLPSPRMARANAARL